MKTEWRSVTIDEIAQKVAMGPFGSSIKVETFVPEGIPVISGQHLHGSRVDDSPGFNFISDEHAQRLANANVMRGDIVFTHAGNIGQVAYIPDNSQFERYVVSQRQFYLRCDRSKAIPEFVTLYFRSPEGQHRLLANRSQVGVPSIAQPVSYLRTIEIPLPPLPEQRAIAHVLGTLDDKIELNRRMNETLEEMARALFKSWFVDFDPVRAKMAGEDTGLPPEVAALFPERLVESELGEIPERWQVRTLEEVAKVIYGAPFSSSRFNNSGLGLPLIRIRDLATHNPTTFTDEQHQKGYLVQPGDFVAGMDGEFRAHIWKGPPAWLNQRVCCFKPHPSIPRTFLLETISKPLAEFERGKSGTTVVHLGKSDIDTIKLAIPKAAILNVFAQLSGPLSRRIVDNASESRTLSALRDALLPRLVSGEVKV